LIEAVPATSVSFPEVLDETRCEESRVLAVAERQLLAAQRQDEEKSEWPIVSHCKPYKIESHQWTAKSQETLQKRIENFDSDPVFFEGRINYADKIFWEKRQDFTAEFEPNQINLFRVILEPIGSISDEVDICTSMLPELFNLKLEQLPFKKMTVQDMSSRQIYLIQSPVRLYIWLGRDLSSLKRQASLRILQSFCKNILNEPLTYKPTYYQSDCKQKSMMLAIRLRIEYQGNESRQLTSLLGNKNDTPINDSRIDYLMLRIPKVNETIDPADDEEDGDDDELPAAIKRAITETESKGRLN